MIVKKSGEKYEPIPLKKYIPDNNLQGIFEKTVKLFDLPDEYIEEVRKMYFCFFQTNFNQIEKGKDIIVRLPGLGYFIQYPKSRAEQMYKSAKNTYRKPLETKYQKTHLVNKYKFDFLKLEELYKKFYNFITNNKVSENAEFEIKREMSKHHKIISKAFRSSGIESEHFEASAYNFDSQGLLL